MITIITARTTTPTEPPIIAKLKEELQLMEKKTEPGTVKSNAC